MKLHIKKLDLLKIFKNTLVISTITLDKKDTSNFNMYSIKEIQVIINHFEKIPTNYL